jgi:Na+/H+ antiporter NhaD/arsenite permease-like protein
MVLTIVVFFVHKPLHMLFFFIGLFVMVGALEEQGAIQKIADGIVDNIPFTATMIPVVEQLGGHEDPAYWWALALGACFGGNATIIAAAANVAAAGMAERPGRPIGFVPFLRIGIPVTLLSLVLATGYVALRYL